MTSSLKNFRSICKKIVCIGRNYREHAHELGNAVPTKPLIFMKPSSSFISEPAQIQIPSEWDELHHEVELGVVIGKTCRQVEANQVDSHIAGYCLALDMTARKVQDDLKKQGHPWLLAKGFDTSCPCGDFIDRKDLNIASSVNLWLKVNDQMRQNGHTRDMIFSIADLIAYISKYITLEHGDLVLTGTPAGVGPVRRGDKIEAGLIDRSTITMTQQVKTKLSNLMHEFPKPTNHIISYGTAGFRTHADKLPWVMIRVGVLAALRSKYKRECIGAMITASHNPEHDNGVKLIDPFGEMLEQSWEVYANELVALDDDVNVLWNYIEDIMTKFQLQPQDEATIAVGYDTRKSSRLLSNIVKRAAQALHATIMDFELVTTPQLHYSVRCYNDSGSYGYFTEAGYFDKLCAAFQTLLEITPMVEELKPLAVDAANGVGALKLAYFHEKLKKILRIDVFNDGTKGRLNENCGADYVKLYQKVPEGIPFAKYTKCCSIDGDADRLIYFFTGRHGKFRILDGDRFSVLFASFLSLKLKEAQLYDQVRMGVIQTAYANGKSTDYLQNTMKIPVACVPTGVKHLHHKALEYDVGIYFEANGHGTIVFSDKMKAQVRAAIEDSNRTFEQRLAANQIRGFINIINETVGDAIADMLATEAVLALLHISLQQWLELYEDLPQRQLKVAVRDRTLIETADAERQCVKPEGLQDAINGLINQYSDGRAFVRPSGTEDIVRVYAEASTQADADRLADDIRKLVERFLN